MDQYLQAKKQIIEYFGLPEELHHVPIIDNRDYYWLMCDYYGNPILEPLLPGEVPTTVDISKIKSDLRHKNLLYNKNYEFIATDIDTDYTCYYRGIDYTLIAEYKHIEKRYLKIFDNSKQITQLE